MKKAFGIILCVVMIIAVTIPALAIITSAKTAELVSGKLNIVIDGGLNKLEAHPGDEIDVKIEFKNNKTISSAKIVLTYDKQLSVVTNKDSSGKDVPAVIFDIYNSEDKSAMYGSNLYASDNKLLLNWLTAVGEVKGDVTYATVKFKVADSAKVGAVLPISAEIDPDDIYDIDIKNADYVLIDGGVEIVKEAEVTTDTEPEVTTEKDTDTDNPGDDSTAETPVEGIKGDINGDNEVNNKDVVILFRYVSSNGDYDAKYDFNGDNNVDNKDVVSLFRYVSSQTSK